MKSSRYSLPFHHKRRLYFDSLYIVYAPPEKLVDL